MSSFANALGGDLVFGVEEMEGSPLAAPGVTVDFDTERLRLLDLIRNGITPRLPSVDVIEVKVGETKSIVVVRVPQSWVGPHMVVFRGASRFYLRDAGQKHQMDVGEIRDAFLTSNAQADRFRSFQNHRLGRLLVDDTPVRLASGPKLVTHIFPVSSNHSIDIVRLESDFVRLFPPFMLNPEHRFNADGFLFNRVRAATDGRTTTYIQFFRDGRIELVRGGLAHPWVEDVLLHDDLAQTLLDGVPTLVRYLAEQGIAPPAFLFAALVGAKGYRVRESTNQQKVIDRDLVILPDVFVGETADVPDATFLPIFDTIWQAAGWAKCQRVTPEGGIIRGERS